MENNKIKPREPTETKLSGRSKVSQAQRKKLYRKRTMDEVRKSIHFAENTYDDGDPEKQDPAQKTVDTAVDSARTATDVAWDRVKNYSDKLRTGKQEGLARSELLKDESEVTKSAAKVVQKSKIKKEYAKAVREAGKTASDSSKVFGIGKSAAEKGADIAGKLIEQVGKFISGHPLGCVLAALLLVVVLTVISCIGSIGIIFGGPNNSSLVTAAFTAKDADLKKVESNYAAKESALQAQISNIKNNYSGYNEYKYNLADIGHDPYQLAAYLTIKYDAYEPGDVASELTSLFKSQYSLTTKKVTETRYRKEKRTGYRVIYEYDEDGEISDTFREPYIYYVRVAYDYYILEVTLKNNGLDSVIRSKLNAEETERYETLVALKGGRDDLWP